MDFLYSNGSLRIKKRTLPEFLILIILMFPFFEKFFTEIVSLPRASRFIVDVIVVVLFFFLFFRGHLNIKNSVASLALLILLFFFYVLFSYIFSYQSLLYFFWGTRNYFRFYIFFFIIVMVVKDDYAALILNLFDCLFWIHAPVCLFQFFVLNVRQDFLGGLFGIFRGSNGYSLIFFCIIVAKSFFRTFNGDEKTIYCVLKCGTSLLIAAMAEMKFYFFCFILIMLITSLLTQLTKRKFLILLASSFFVVTFSLVLSNIFSDGSSFLSFEKFIDLATKENYSSGEDLNRLSAIPTLMKNYVTEPLQQLFGLGLGNCDSSNISIFNTPFYLQHSQLHYSWFTSAILFLETGFVGLFLYLSFFIVCLIKSLKHLKQGVGSQLYCQMGVVISTLSLMLMFYNATLRNEAAYMIYFVLALPFISSEKKKESETEAIIEK